MMITIKDTSSIFQVSKKSCVIYNSSLLSSLVEKYKVGDCITLPFSIDYYIGYFDHSSGLTSNLPYTYNTLTYLGASDDIMIRFLYANHKKLYIIFNKIPKHVMKKLLDKHLDIIFILISDNNIFNRQLFISIKHLLNTINENGDTPLLYAIKNSYNDSVRILISADVDINYQDHNGNTALHYAVKKKNIKCINMIIENNANVHIKNYEGYDVLMISILENDYEIISILLIADAKLNLDDNKHFTPLIYAVHNNNIKLVRLFIALGVNINYQDKYGNTAAIIAAGKNYITILKTLIDTGADLYIKNNKGETVSSIL